MRSVERGGGAARTRSGVLTSSLALSAAASMLGSVSHTRTALTTAESFSEAVSLMLSALRQSGVLTG